MKRIASIISIIILATIVAFVPSAATLAQQNYKYVAMGDSVAAGAGLPARTETSALDQLCGRSADAYSQDIANYYHISVQNIACSGAKVDEGIYGEQERQGTELEAQTEKAFRGQNPDLITLTVGVNDMRWQQVIAKCIQSSCGSSFDNFRASAYLADLRIELNWALWRIYQKSDSDPPLVAMSGYYNPFSTQNCAASQGITNREARWISEQMQELNNVITDASNNFYFATYAPVDFSGHEVCANDSWVQGRSAPAPYHPTSDGQKAIADAFLSAFRQY